MSTATRPKPGATAVQRRLAKLETELLEVKDFVRATLVSSVPTTSAPTAVSPEPSTYLRSARANESLAAFRRAFAQFEADSPKLAVVLRWSAEGMQVDEIAALLERTPASTRAMLAVARTKLRPYLPQWQSLSWMIDVGIVASAEWASAVSSRDDRQVITKGSNNEVSTDANRGLDSARARGEVVKLGWVRDGEVIPARQVAAAWGITPQALGVAASRGEAFALKVKNKLYYPRVFVELEREAVAAICLALGGLSASEKLVFFTKPHGSLQGNTLVAALRSETALPKAVKLAEHWASERGSVRAVEKT